jgi:predicted transcriptional regulator
MVKPLKAKEMKEVVDRCVKAVKDELRFADEAYGIVAKDKRQIKLEIAKKLAALK